MPRNVWLHNINLAFDTHASAHVRWEPSLSDWKSSTADSHIFCIWYLNLPRLSIKPYNLDHMEILLNNHVNKKYL